MTNAPLALGSLGVVLLALWYNTLTFALVSTFLENLRLNKWWRLPMAALNTVLLYGGLALQLGEAFVFYLAFFVALFLEFSLFHKDSPVRVFFVSSACLLHLMGIRAVIVAIMAAAGGQSFLYAATQPAYRLLSLGLVLLLLCLSILVVMKCIPPQKIKVINKHGEQLFFMCLWISVFNVYLLLNARAYTHQSDSFFILENQIALPLAILVGLYVVLFFSFKTSELLGYREQNDELLQDISREQQYREAIVSDALFSYEVNFSQKKVLAGFEEYREAFGELVADYDFMREQMAHVLVCPEDAQMVAEYAKSENIVAEFQSGKSESTIEYRRVDGEGVYRWVKAVTHLYRDKASGDILGFTYIKDIDKEKRQQLDLRQRAERDSLTGLYNKGTAEFLTSAYLELDHGQKNTGALFLIDVDYFKAINDHLGHSFGDKVLCQLAEKLKAVFRVDDVVGRAGGDEFMVFMKRTAGQNIIREKGALICEAFRMVYTSDFGVRYAISASIGVACYPRDGASFGELYRKADIALYTAKNKGKDTYSLYGGESFAGYEGNRTQIDKDTDLQQFFKDNRTGYVFKTLYAAADSKAAIEAVLELLTKHYNYSRGYIFETEPDGKTTTNTFEWCNSGIEPEIQSLKKVPIEAVQTAAKAFYRDGQFVLNRLDDLPPLDRSVLEPQGIKSMLQFGIFEAGKLVGFIGFDDCDHERTPGLRETEELATICHIIAVFLLKYRALQKLDARENMA